MNDDDPFVEVKLRVDEALEHANGLADSWKRIHHTVSSPSNQELLWTADELNASLEGIELDLDDLTEALKAAQANPDRFYLSSFEIKSRREFLTASRKNIQDIRYMLAHPPPKTKMETFDDEDDSYARRYEASNSRALEQDTVQINMAIREQDEQLDSISGTLHRMRGIAGTMGNEVEDQTILLDDLGERVDRTQSKMSRALQRTKEILRREEESKSGYCICCLIIILIVLLILVIVM